MSRRANQHARALAQMGATKQDADKFVHRLFPKTGKRTDIRIAAAVRKFNNPRGNKI